MFYHWKCIQIKHFYVNNKKSHVRKFLTINIYSSGFKKRKKKNMFEKRQQHISTTGSSGNHQNKQNNVRQHRTMLTILILDS